MMKKIFFSFLITLLSIFSFSQCVPNPIYQDSLPNVWPVSGFPDGTVGVSYSQIWTMKIPETLIEAALGDTAFVTVDTLGQSIYIGDWLVDSVKIMEVLNTPPGMSVDCNTSDYNIESLCQYSRYKWHPNHFRLVQLKSNYKFILSRSGQRNCRRGTFNSASKFRLL